MNQHLGKPDLPCRRILPAGWRAGLFVCRSPVLDNRSAKLGALIYYARTVPG
ncbi:MAG: hypothetical protein QHH10_07140 [Peptococcaceae bacterium]|nr:hypothetical protein [Peptococcaceae bacterium]